ncbi:unnamed protein product [Auanema sp. JU1783]|nr:unnamed protein product [Auanema sp. JU1783]
MANFCPNNRDSACFLVTKLSWKGRYKRIFSIGTLAVSTYNPQTLEITNQWGYEDFISIKPTLKNNSNDNSKMDEFVIVVRNKGKRDTMKFASEYAADIITECLLLNTKFADQTNTPTAINAVKHSWSGQRIPVILRANAAAMEQVDNRGVVVQIYPYKDIKSVGKISNAQGMFQVEMGDHRRRHAFASANMEKIVEDMRQLASDNLGIVLPIDKKSITVDDFEKTRLGLCSTDDKITSYAEFPVNKYTKRRDGHVRRILCLSESCLIERDPASYSVICATPLKNIVCLARLEKDPQQFVIEYVTGYGRIYSSSERDLILASLLDGIRASGNEQVFVSGHRFDRALRLTPHNVLLDEDGESQMMRLVISPSAGLRRSDLIRRFNANIPYNGLTYSRTHDGFFSEKKGKVIVAALEAVLCENYEKDDPQHVHKTEAQLQCLRRLFASKSGFQAFTEVNGVREKLGTLVIRALSKKNESVDHAVVEALSALMHPMHDQYEIRIEQLNKKSLLSSPKFVEELLDLVVNHVNRGTGWLVIASMLDFLTYSVCAPYSETTEGSTFDFIIKLVADRGRSFYRLFHTSSMTIVKGAGMVMRAIIEEADPEISKRMQTLALTEGAFLSHLQSALLSKGKDLRVMTNKQLSGHLISLWLSENIPANELMTRCLPRGLLNFLNSDAEVPVKEADLLIPRNNLEAATNEQRAQGPIKEKLDYLRVTAEASLDRFVQHWDLEQKLNFNIPRRVGDDRQQQRPVVLRKRRQRVRSVLNWRLFAYQFGIDHAQADLIWNEKTRTEFSKSIETELITFKAEKERASNDIQLSWNHTEYQVIYPSLEDEIKIGDYYLRVMLQEADDDSTPIHNPLEFFNDVYHRFLLSAKSEMRCFCLRAMAVAYCRNHETIGAFADAKYFVSMLSKCNNPQERDQLVFLLSKLVLNRDNVRELMLANVLPLLVDLCDLAHLDVKRAVIQNQTNAIEASANQQNAGEAKEWRYNDKEGQQQGPFSFNKMKELYSEKVIFEKSAVWASGMDKWQTLSSVPQFRWTVCLPPGALGLYRFTELCSICLDIMNKMCEYYPSRDSYGSVVRPMPGVKLRLTEPVLLYHIVQLLLTYEPSIVKRVATLLLHIIEDNPFLPRLHLTGVFYFILMYNGSDVLPIARFLHYTHRKQAFQSAMFGETRQSILSPLLPEAAVFYLDHYGPDKYSEVYLGEFDNPEVIWNTEMRKHMIRQIAIHIGDFYPRLTSNVKALYQFCPIPTIDYPELENELFCHVYYLRHLCDKQRFPDWPIRDPVPFLRACLAAWHGELVKKPPAMSIEQACETLGLSMADDSWQERSVVRKAYYKLSIYYHPDKLTDENRDKEMEFRDMFAKVNAAYELLSSNINRTAQMAGPDTQRIILCLQAQSIIYSRYKEELSVYKYAGYDRLIRTIEIEANDESLFRKTGGGILLSAAIELCNHTLMSSALNAEQLRRDQGLEALQTAFDRCYAMITMNSQPTDIPVQVCEHICNCFATAAQFEQCRQRLAELPTLFGNLCHLLQFSQLPRLSSAAAECVCGMAVDTLLQTQLFQAGILWQLVPHLFHFDYTLDEGGVQHSENSNKQSLANRLARSSCEALACLAGFREHTPDNDGVQNSLRALLTPYVCRLIRTTTNDIVLKVLNCNTEDPYLIWDNATRAEVLQFVERHRTSHENSSELFGAEFQLSVYAKELIVGDVFIRIYNEQPNFPLHEPKKMAMDLLDFIGKYMDELTGAKKLNGDLIDIDWSSNANQMSSAEKVLMCIEAINNLIVANPGVEILLIGHFNLLISYLRAKNHPKIQIGILKVLSLAAGNRECVSDFANVRPCSTLFGLILEREDELPLILNILIALASNGQIVKDVLDYGGVLFILAIFGNSRKDPAVRLQAAELLAKLQADKLTGPRWTRFITKYLPPIFADALRDSPTTAITMFDSSNENPELIWNETTRGKVQQILEEGVKDIYAKQKIDPDTKWNVTLSDDSCAYSDSVSGELIVGGVFVRLFVANPAWAVRHPRQFATELIEKVLDLMKKPGDDLSVVTKAFTELMRYHPNTADQLPAQGYLPQFCAAMSSKDPRASQAAILILQQLSDNEHCADALCRINCIQGIMVSMKNQPTLMRESAHALKCLMKRGSGDLASQMLNCGMIEYLLDVLKSPMPGVENSAAARAEIVDALKSACLDLKAGEKISTILNASPIWSQYKDQRHDLFLPDARMQAITGSSTGISGYLTEGMFNPPPLHSQPPPL